MRKFYRSNFSGGAKMLITTWPHTIVMSCSSQSRSKFQTVSWSKPKSPIIWWLKVNSNTYSRSNVGLGIQHWYLVQGRCGCAEIISRKKYWSMRIQRKAKYKVIGSLQWWLIRERKLIKKLVKIIKNKIKNKSRISKKHSNLMK